MAVDAERFRLMLQGRPEAMRVQQSELVAAFGPGFWFSECPQEVLNEWADCTSVGGASIMRKTVSCLLSCLLGIQTSGYPMKDEHLDTKFSDDRH